MSSPFSFIGATPVVSQRFFSVLFSAFVYFAQKLLDKQIDLHL